MTAAVFIASAFIAGGSVGAVCGYIGGRRSSREELAAAQVAWAVQNAAPDRDELAEVALPPERTGDHRKVELYDQDAPSELLPLTSLDDVMAEAGITQAELDALPDPDVSDTTWARAYHLQVAKNRHADPADDTGVGTVKFLSGEWPPAAPAPKQVGQ